LKVLYSKKNIHLLDYLFLNINRKAIADCILKLLNIYSCSFDDSSYKLEILDKIIISLEYRFFNEEYQDLIKEYNLPINLAPNEFDFNKFYFYQEKKEVII